MNQPAAKYGFSDPRYEGFPPVVQIALVSGVCPSNCRYCPVGQRNMGELPSQLAAELTIDFFDLELFRKVAEEVARHPWAILRIHSRGEPMVHPEYFKMIALAKRCGVGTVTSFTSGILLHRFVDAVLDSQIDLLEVSADAADGNRYALWRRNDHFHEVVEGVRCLRATLKRRSLTRPCIVVSAVDHPDFRPHEHDFRAFWGPMCDKVLVRPFHTYAGRIADPYVAGRRTSSHIPCVQLWERFSISTKGLVNACFNDWGDKELVGDLHDPGATISGIWRCDRFETIRARSLKAPYLDCCAACSGSSLSSWGESSYQAWVRKLLDGPQAPQHVAIR